MTALLFAKRDDFISRRHEVLRSGAPITSPEHLKGRDKALRSLTDALKSPGKHAFIYGFRGVGKTSLAQTAAYQLQPASRSPIIISCDGSSTFASICSEIALRALSISPLETKSAVKGSLGVGVTGLGNVNVAGEKADRAFSVSIATVADAIRYFESISAQVSREIYVVIDEFDSVKGADDHQKFSSLIKAMSDQGVRIKFIFCGIAENIENLFSAHSSIARQFHPEGVERLGLQARLDIMSDAEEALGIAIPKDFKYRIAQISDGFPSFVHLISEHVLTCAYDEHSLVASGGAKVSTSSYNKGIELAVEASLFTLRKTYSQAVHRNGRSYESVIWAVANDELLEVNVDEAWRNYERICSDMNIDLSSRSNMNTKLSQLATADRGNILFKPRRSNYSFSEKMMRGYARLCAAKAGIRLGPENPAAV